MNPSSWLLPRAHGMRLCAILLVCAGHLWAARLEPATVQAWDQYTAAVDARMRERLAPGHAFLWADEDAARLAEVRAGGEVVAAVDAHIPKPVPNGLIHDWVGATFVRGAHLADILAITRNYGEYKQYFRPTVVESKAMGSADAVDHFSLLLKNQAFFARSMLEMSYASQFHMVSETRAYSTAVTEHVRQIDDYGKPEQATLPEGQGLGMIWKPHSLARYEERDGGVYMEVEAVALSRDIPEAVRWMVDPIVRRVSRNSLVLSLKQTAEAARARMARISGDELWGDAGGHGSRPAE